MALELLCAADIHLGRPINHLPEIPDPRSVLPEAAWWRLVDLALERKPLAVLLAGDIVDFENKYYESLGVLEKGARKLVKAGINVVAVAGNHDFDSLARIADKIPEFILLGRGGVWEERVLSREGCGLLRLRGLSFNQNHIRQSPFLIGYRFEHADDLPVVGLLHCDVGNPTSPYAPIARDELRRPDMAAWILGHIHQPGLVLTDHPLSLYCGSLQGLDPTETGKRGAWMLRIDDAGRASTEHIGLASLRWESEEVAAEGMRDKDSFEQAVIEAQGRIHRRIADAMANVSDVGCRLRFTGRSEAHLRLRSWIAAEEYKDWKRESDGIRYFIDKIEDSSRPAFSMDEVERMAGDSSPPGLLAHKLVVLSRKQPPEEYEDLMRKAGRALDAVASQKQFLPLDPGELYTKNEERTRGVLIAAATDALERLLAQKEGAA